MSAHGEFARPKLATRPALNSLGLDNRISLFGNSVPKSMVMLLAQHSREPELMVAAE